MKTADYHWAGAPFGARTFLSANRTIAQEGLDFAREIPRDVLLEPPKLTSRTAVCGQECPRSVGKRPANTRWQRSVLAKEAL